MKSNEETNLLCGYLLCCLGAFGRAITIVSWVGLGISGGDDIGVPTVTNTRQTKNASANLQKCQLFCCKFALAYLLFSSLPVLPLVSKTFPSISSPLGSGRRLKAWQSFYNQPLGGDEENLRKFF